MSKLVAVKDARNLHDVAHLLGFKPKALSYLLYVQKSGKYDTFKIPKRNGGERIIDAPSPKLRLIQKRLAKLLEECIEESSEDRGLTSKFSHGFKRKHSIVTNALNHRKKRYVFNIDLHDFFGSINFGRVRGFFIHNNHFKLDPKIATILAQICCYQSRLPQGSPCSPVVSNLVGHLLDMRLAPFAEKFHCHYSRYADDITFSTNELTFPSQIATVDKSTSEHIWVTSKSLNRLIRKTGFAVNDSKTRMQYSFSRQEVTGLIVNSKVNTSVEYRKLTRAMVNKLLENGEFTVKKYIRAKSGESQLTVAPGTIENLGGRLSFIDSVNVYNRFKELTAKSKKKQLFKPYDSDSFSSVEMDYRHFLFYKMFNSSQVPLILCEGKTDNIYLEIALSKLSKKFPDLVKEKDGKQSLEIEFFVRSSTTSRLMGLSGGSAEFREFITEYKNRKKYISTSCVQRPVIMLLDNDGGTKPIVGYVANIKGVPTIDRTVNFIYVCENLYLILTPIKKKGDESAIEDCFEKSLLAQILNRVSSEK